MGGIDMVHALTRADLPCAVLAPPDDPVQRSRHVVARLRWADPWREPDEVVRILLEHAAGQPEPPVLYPPTDGMILLASRRREELAPAYRLALAEAELVEDLLDKGRFAALAERLGLPVPRTARLAPGDDTGAAGLAFPVIVKPFARGTGWRAGDPYAKAKRVDDAEGLRREAASAAQTSTELLVQELVPGPETRIESYHVYVDEAGRTAGEFTGRKIRTLPPSFGESTAVEITAESDVVRAGREAVERMQLRGVAKVDFKRTPAGRLVLLEVNPRFNLWHLPAARAGLNLPALVHADLTGRPRPAAARARPGVRWSDPVMDFQSARAAGVGLVPWAVWTARCHTHSGFAWGDPAPFVGSTWPRVRKRLVRLLPGREGA